MRLIAFQWQRAETLGALVNGVFLVALCLSIFLDAIQRFVEPQSVSNPKLVLVVGCFGLLSNVLGLLLFHEHGHSHGGGHSHSHAGTDKLAVAEEGHSHATPDGHTQAVADETGNVADVLPQTTVAGWPKSTNLEEASGGTQQQRGSCSRGYTRSDEDDSTVANSTSSPLSVRKSRASGTRHRRHQNSGGSRSRFSSVDDIPIHPSFFRNDFIAASREKRLEDIESRNGSDSDEEAVMEEEHEPAEGSPLLGHEPTEGSPLLGHEPTEGSPLLGHEPTESSPLLGHKPTESSPLLGHKRANSSANHVHNAGNSHSHNAYNHHDSWHADHKHNQLKEESGGGHSHGDLNMRGVFLHVMGDALGNIGVIGSALIIWLTNFSWRFYADPAISLVITLIILGSAIPLCKAASRILLQAVPAGISVDDIKDDIEDLDGILSCHHLHVWQLSDIKMIASLHVQVEFDFKGEGSARYMQLARAVRRCLHGYGIHSSTIQPEFCLDSEHRHTSALPSDNEGSDSGNGRPKGSKGCSKAPSMRSEPEACLLDCGDECDEGSQCCAPNTVEADMHNEEGHSH